MSKGRKIYTWPAHCYLCEAPVEGTQHLRVIVERFAEVVHEGKCAKELKAHCKTLRIVENVEGKRTT